MYTSLRPALLAMLALVCAGVGCSQCTPTMVVIPLAVAVHSSTALSATEAGQIVQSSGKVLQIKDATDDVVCDVKLQVDSIDPLETGDGVVDSKLAFDALFAGTTPAAPRRDVRVVSEITWCGAIIASAAGCGDPPPGLRVAVARRGNDREGILWAHEVGHTRGLQHRPDLTALMNPTILPDHNVLHSSECTDYRK
jgi:hypothetical protein